MALTLMLETCLMQSERQVFVDAVDVGGVPEAQQQQCRLSIVLLNVLDRQSGEENVNDRRPASNMPLEGLGTSPGPSFEAATLAIQSSSSSNSPGYSWIIR